MMLPNNLMYTKDLEWIKDWYIRWGHEIESFDDKKKML